MTFEEAEAVVRRITYKPSWLIHFKKRTKRIWWLWFTLDTLDTFTLEPITVETPIVFISEDFEAEDIISAVWAGIRRAEEHESQEMFKVDNVALYNPHITISAAQNAFFETFPDRRTVAIDTPSVVE